MSTVDEEPYSTIFASLKHPIRRRILRMLSKEPMSFMEMVEVLGVSNSFLTYHLDNLGELISKMEDGKYKLSSFGEAANATMTRVEDIPTTLPHQSLETRTKKIVGRSVAIALGTICILLIASLGGTLAYYTMTIHNKENELASANSTISQLNTNVTNLQNQNKQLQTWLVGNLTLLDQTETWLNDNVTAYNRVQYDVRSIHVVSENSTVLVNNETYSRYDGTILENNETVHLITPPLWDFWAPYAGSVSILFSSNNTPTRVEVLSYSISSYLNGSVDMFYLFDGGSIGWYYFPVSPSTHYSISLCNPLGKPSDFTVTITYYY
jgi:DNA-binding transcriptional ArsR family regulator